MPKLAVMGSPLKCSKGLAPSVLVALPTTMVFTPQPAADMMAMVPMMNIPPFGMCNSPANPMVAAATAAALGVLTPMPCIPVPVAPWSPPVKALAGVMPLASEKSKLQCAFGGAIKILFPGQVIAEST